MDTAVPKVFNNTVPQELDKLKKIISGDKAVSITSTKDKVDLSEKTDDSTFIPPKTYPLTPEKQKLIDTLLGDTPVTQLVDELLCNSPMPYKHKENFQNILSRLNEKRLQELITQDTKFVVFNKNNIPEDYKKMVVEDRDAILDAIFTYLHKLTDIPSGNIYNREAKMFFLNGYLEEQKQLQDPNPAIILTYKNKPVMRLKDITDLDIFCTTGGYYDHSNKTMYIPEWNTQPETIAHELTHALDDARLTDQNNRWKIKFFTNKPMEILLFSFDSPKASEIKQLYSEYLSRCTQNCTVIPETFVGPDIWSGYAASFAKNILNGSKKIETIQLEYLAEGGMKFILEPNALWSADKKMYFFVKQFMEEE